MSRRRREQQPVVVRVVEPGARPSAELREYYHGGHCRVAYFAGLTRREAVDRLGLMADATDALGWSPAYCLIDLPSGAALVAFVPKADCTGDDFAAAFGLDDPWIAETIARRNILLVASDLAMANTYMAEIEAAMA